VARPAAVGLGARSLAADRRAHRLRRDALPRRPRALGRHGPARRLARERGVRARDPRRDRARASVHVVDAHRARRSDDRSLSDARASAARARVACVPRRRAASHRRRRGGAGVRVGGDRRRARGPHHWRALGRVHARGPRVPLRLRLGLRLGRARDVLLGLLPFDARDGALVRDLAERARGAEATDAPAARARRDRVRRRRDAPPRRARALGRAGRRVGVGRLVRARE
jgi:hypothetical protein